MERSRTESTTWRAIYALVILGLLVAFMLSVKAVLNPVLLFLLVVLVASPFAGERSHRLLVGAAGLLTVVWLLDTLGPLLAPFFLALGLSYVLYPLVRRIERRGVSRGLAIAILALPVLALIALVAFIGIPALLRQLGQLIRGVPQAIQSLVAWVERMQMELARRDFAYVDESAILERLRALQPEAVLQYLQARQAAIARNIWVAMTGAGRGLSFVLSVLGYLVLAPILGFYLLRDWERIQASLAGLVPPASRPRVLAFAREYDRLLAGYIRGALLAASIIGTLTFLGLWIMGIPFAFLLGAMAAVFNLIPYVGLVLTLIPALVVALFTGNIVVSLLKVLLVFGIVQTLDGTVIGPRVVGGSVGLHPVWVILALSVAGFFWGFVGLLLAVPLAVLVKLLLREAIARYRRSRAFLGDHA
jgi:predicted PurR-regulated permease PerM